MLLPQHSLVREYSPGDITSIPATGTTDPGVSEKSALGEAYRRLQLGAFADWRLSVEDRVATPRTFSLGQLKQLRSRTQITLGACSRRATRHRPPKSRQS